MKVWKTATSEGAGKHIHLPKTFTPCVYRSPHQDKKNQPRHTKNARRRQRSGWAQLETYVRCSSGHPVEVSSRLSRTFKPEMSLLSLWQRHRENDVFWDSVLFLCLLLCLLAILMSLTLSSRSNLVSVCVCVSLGLNDIVLGTLSFFGHYACE